MSGFASLLKKEFLEIRRTWRLPTVGGVLLFFAIMSPIAALATPALVASVVGSQPGLVIEVPDPTYVDSYAQWVKNLSQIGLLLVVFSSAGLLAGERASGTAVLVASKPVSRFAIAASKFVAQAVLVAVSTLVGAALVLGGTAIGFPEAPPGLLVSATLAWLGGALVAVAVTLALSAFLSTIASGVVSLAVFGLAGIAGLWEPAVRYTPIGLLVAPGTLLAGEPAELLWPSVTAGMLVGGLVWLAGVVFSKREL